MAAATVRIRGLKEVNRAFRRLETGIDKELKDGLKKASEPTAEQARSAISRYPGASTSTIKPYASQKGAVVRQSQRKRTGKHPGFGALQMQHLLAALDDNQDQIMGDVEKLLDHLTREEGF